MSADSEQGRCAHAELMPLYVLRALPPGERRLLDGHLTGCSECQRELESLRPVLESWIAWPTDILRPADSLWEGLQERIGGQAIDESVPQEVPAWREPDWEDVAPGISCKLLATDTEGDRVSMLVRLAPGTAYPPHRHAGVEELFLLDGELWIDDRKLYPGDYNRGEAGMSDDRVWSETGCTCVLITSPSDVIS
ncbi:MAG TPA: cupin domain-containing protein [Steroidobacteraceae bacterium]|nr:cupin domain-containing protein [Steroidobacteraceae bacterium]